jgi:membrane protease YdiL (CAAX protease family)
MKKLLQFPVLRILIVVLLVGLATAIGQIILGLLRTTLSITNPAIANLLAFLLIIPLTYFAYRFYVRRIETREMTELGFSHAWSEFGIGALLGFGLITLVIVLLWLLGDYQVTGLQVVFLPLFGALLGALTSAWVQELIFRAGIYRITEEWLGTWWALVISALLFGLIHLTSAGATLISALAVSLEAGILLGAAYTLTHRLWMALGIHMAWDFANDGIYGVGIAGQTGARLSGLLQAKLSGPVLLTGGALGVEASIITLIVMLIAGLALLWMAYRKGQFVSLKRSAPVIIQE